MKYDELFPMILNHTRKIRKLSQRTFNESDIIILFIDMLFCEWAMIPAKRNFANQKLLE